MQGTPILIWDTTDDKNELKIEYLADDITERTLNGESIYHIYHVRMITEFLPRFVRDVLPDRASEFTAVSKYVLCYEKTEYMNSFKYWYEN